MATTVCSNCGTCSCTGAYPVKAIDGTQVCSACVVLYNANIKR